MGVYSTRIALKKLGEYRFAPIFPSQPISDPQVSPDGGSVLFTHSTLDMKGDKYHRHVWLMPVGGRPRQFTYGEKGESSPRWSPDGGRVLFLSSRPCPEDNDEKVKSQLFVIPADGGEARRITSVEEGVQQPIWAPDGRNVLFASRVFKGEKAKDSDVKIIRRMKYRTDGQGYYVGKYTHLFSVPTRGGKVRQLTDGEFDAGSASWSPDSKRIAFVSYLDEDMDLTHYKNIYTVHARGGDPELLWKGEGPIGSVSWSPDGRYIAFTGWVIEDPSCVWYRNTDLWVLPVDGGEPVNLTTGLDRTVGRGGVRWTRDSQRLYFTHPDRGGTKIERVGLDGEVEPLVKGRMTMGSFTVDDSDSVIAFNASDQANPYELWVNDGDTPRRLTELTKVFMKKQVICPPEEFWFTASDGVPIQGWIVKPHGYKEGKRYPTVLQVHGGPRGAYGYTYGPAEHEFQALASNGFAVAYTNPRGSTGFGEEFARAVSGHYGERDYEDVMEAVDHITEAYPFVDPGRLGIAGGSYGGFMVNWVVGHTDRFAAAVTMRSISNWYSDHGSSDISWLDHDINLGRDPWDIPDEIMAVSPISYIRNIVTPLLIIHSENDYRCRMEQAEQLFIGLKKLGRTVEFVRFPDEPHGLSRTGKPKHRVERLQHIVRWFDRHLR